MTDTFAISNRNKTPYGFTDQNRPRVMLDADSILKRVVPNPQRNVNEVLVALKKTSDLIRDTKNYDIDKFWSQFEKKVNHGNHLSVKADTGIQQLMTGFSLFYSGLNIIDQGALSTQELEQFRSLYNSLLPFVKTKFISHLDSKDQNLFNRVVTATDKRLSAVVDNFNARVDKGTISGSALRA